MKKVTTASGFSVSVDLSAFDDMELVEKLALIDDNLYVLPDVLRMTLGEKGKKALYDHVRDKKGRAPATKVAAEFKEIMDLLGDDSKNS